MTPPGKIKKIERILSRPPESQKSASPETSSASPMDRLKSCLKTHGRLYSFLVEKLGPVFMHPRNRARLDQTLREYGENDVVVNIGSGPARWPGRPDIINVDIVPYADVDVVAGETIPLKDGCADLLICISALEHIPQPRRTVAEMHRIAKPGGRALIFVPFMQPYHAAPGDYGRWTASGLKNLAAPFEVEEAWIGGGPTSGLLWVLQEWLALALSLGSRRVSEILLPMIMTLTFPLKWLDLVLIYHPHAGKIASGFYVLARKSATDNSATPDRS